MANRSLSFIPRRHVNPGEKSFTGETPIAGQAARGVQVGTVPLTKSANSDFTGPNSTRRGPDFSAKVSCSAMTAASLEEDTKRNCITGPIHRNGIKKKNLLRAFSSFFFLSVDLRAGFFEIDVRKLRKHGLERCHSVFGSLCQ